MFENVLVKLARALGSQPVGTTIIPLSGTQMSNVAVYPEMTARRATREGYKLSIWVYAAIRAIVQPFSTVPWVVVDQDGQPIPGHELGILLDHPNDVFSSQDLMEILGNHLLLCGNALWQPLIVNGKPRELWPVMPDLVRPIPSSVPGEWLAGWDVTTPGGQFSTLPPEQFIHHMFRDPGNPYWGIGPLRAAARTVDSDNEAQDTQKISMQNRGVPDGVFQTMALSQPQYEEATRQVTERYLKKDDRRKPWVVGGLQWQQMSLTPLEMDFIASRLSNLRSIAAAFNLDPYWLGDRSTTPLGGSNSLELRRGLYELAVIPLLDTVKAVINMRLAPMYPGNIRVAYDLTGVPAMREDMGAKIDQASRLFAMAVPFSQINDKLKLGFEEFDGWDAGYLPANLMPVGASSPAPVAIGKSLKSLDPDSEEYKAAYWKAADRRRMAYWPIVAKKAEALYRAEGVRVATATDIASAKRAIEFGRPAWEKALTAVLVTLVGDFGGQTADDLGAAKSERKWRFDPFSAAAKQWLVEHAAESITSILDTNLDDVKRVIVAAREADMTTTELGRKLRIFYEDSSPFKAMRVARTEVSASAGFGQWEAASQSGVAKFHGWVSSRDDRVRDSHAEIDGEKQPFGEPYSNGLMFPGDPSGDAAESVMCRCVEQFFSR